MAWEGVCRSESCIWSFHGAKDILCEPQKSAAVPRSGAALLLGGALPTDGALMRSVRPTLVTFNRAQ